MKNISQERLNEITKEVFSLSNNPFKLEIRLQEVMQQRISLESIELATYLRASNLISDQLPTWQPLLNASIEQARMRGDPENDIFYGLNVPRYDIMFKNTDSAQRRQQKRS